VASVTGDIYFWGH